MCCDVLVLGQMPAFEQNLQDADTGGEEWKYEGHEVRLFVCVRARVSMRACVRERMSACALCVLCVCFVCFVCLYV